MGLFDFFEDNSNQYNNDGVQPHHEAKFSHELIAGAAAYEAAKAYQDHQKANGNPVDHETAKDLLAGFSGAFIDREVETRGLDFIDSQRAKRQAREHIDQNFTEDVYVQQNNYGNY